MTFGRSSWRAPAWRPTWADKRSGHAAAEVSPGNPPRRPGQHAAVDPLRPSQGCHAVALPVSRGFKHHWDARARFRFERDQLEVRFLTPDLVRVTWGTEPKTVPYEFARTDWPEVSLTLRE